MFSLKVRVEFDSKNQALRFFKSIKPEIEEDYVRSKTRVSQKENILEFLITASDKTALRASLNSITKPLKLFEEIEEL
ncbi:MAG: KEOPS complex subunit Pcc1 [Candidatus ainarchaeum sp.]|jgi:tRNA threonylcarbamoyladenosine modification (KEOPS) complex  Pcc1 subunit|nr:KEOPS complex subunit Pcc1 [Candidatus ainarchaeum sp.]MDD3085554.1 KEOPS complex subunit Pcc1 [Candidatus ainarchaeum sp.]MDD4128746.1 KEOPS complex subunit Pcc1 [Candidatus ainarchaeum sp.]MDD4467717.1 KEOPS complex subunit Pcc1 [Candidatus ainarchaeum sp.]HPM85775.1 KEOPS complex subunit Pcc1 [archaeon]